MLCCLIQFLVAVQHIQLKSKEVYIEIRVIIEYIQL